MFITSFEEMVDALSKCVNENARAVCRLDMDMGEFRDLTDEYMPHEMRYLQRSAPGVFTDSRTGTTRRIDPSEQVLREFCDGRVDCELYRTSTTTLASRQQDDTASVASFGRRGLLQQATAQTRHSFIKSRDANNADSSIVTRDGGAGPNIETFKTPDQISARWVDVMNGPVGRNAGNTNARLVGSCSTIAEKIDDIFNN